MAWGSWYGYRKPQTVSSRKAKAEKHLAAAAKNKVVYDPVRIEGRTIARSFWGKAWNHNLESYSDYENRLPRGRSYLSSGQVLDLKIGAGTIDALVMGSSLYRVEVRISPLPAPRWKALSAACAGKVGSLVELLQGRLSDQVMAVVTRHGEGLFPSPREITKSCSCPDWADVCKHVAAVLYGVGARLDRQPELLFLLRGVDHLDLIGAAAEGPLAADGARVGPTIADEDVAGIFGIELEAEDRPAEKTEKPKAARPKAAPPKIAAVGSGKTKRTSPTVSAQELIALGVRRTAIQAWLMERVLVPTERRGVYRRTAYTDERIAAYLERGRVGRS